MYHQITVLGRATADPEVRMTSADAQVANFTLAVNEGFGDNQKTLWFRVAAWRKLAEVCERMVTKGTTMLITGKLVDDGEGNPRVWSGSDGKANASFEITVKDLRIIGGTKPRGDGEGGPPTEAEEEIPF